MTRLAKGIPYLYPACCYTFLTFSTSVLMLYLGLTWTAIAGFGITIGFALLTLVVAYGVGKCIERAENAQ